MKTLSLETQVGAKITLSSKLDSRIVGVQSGYVVVACASHRTELVNELRAWGVRAPNTYVRTQTQG